MVKQRTLNQNLLKFNRLIVWILLILIVLVAVSGYGLTKPRLISSLSGGLIDYDIAYTLHMQLDFYLLIMLLFHVAIEIRFSLIRWGFKHRKLLNILILVLIIESLALLIFVEYMVT